ncbi:MAG: aspartate-semialdehyde dehydrogenase [Actinobacteria bacterium]|nr:aspartate-semialdehyde dehydrogenase [Actinomycetota bacterium]
MSRQYRVAVVGATGAVGEEMRRTLAERGFPVSELTALASARSAGKELAFGDQNIVCRELREDSFADIDLALFSAGGSISAKFAPIARDSGCVVVDNSSSWRMDPAVPLIVPEVNPHDAEWHSGIIANPNCSTIQMVVALKPLHDAVQIKRVVVSTYQAVSGTGVEAVTELQRQVKDISEGRGAQVAVYPHQIAFNCLPHIDVFLDDGSTKEEQKMVDETKKILGDTSIAVSATCVRVPVYDGHSEAVNLEFEREITPDQARDLLARTPGIVVEDNPETYLYPLPIRASGTDPVYVGRIRRDPTVRHGLNLWVVADNLRKGAALNAVQVAELLVQKNLIRVP